jgi:hypothetical protein
MTRLIVCVLLVALVAGQNCTGACTDTPPAVPSGACPDGVTLYGAVCQSVAGNCTWVTVDPNTVCNCTNGKLFSTCGSSCPATCSVPSPGSCPLACVTGCFCPSNMLLDGDRCVLPANCPVITPVLNCSICALGTECDTLTGLCVAVSCDAPHPCPYRLSCLPRPMTCVRAPCPQFVCTPCMPCHSNCGIVRGRGRGNDCDVDSRCTLMTEGQLVGCLCPAYACVKKRGCLRTHCFPPPPIGCYRNNTVDLGGCLQCGEISCE